MISYHIKNKKQNSNAEVTEEWWENHKQFCSAGFWMNSVFKEK